VTLGVPEIEALAARALRAAGARPENAASLARAVAAAERDGIASHGLAYLPTYCEHLRCGKVNAAATPRISTAGTVVRVDADCGFAHPAIQLGSDSLVQLAKEYGVAVLAVTNSYNCGVLGYHTEALATRGVVALGFTNAPASIAAFGGRKPVLGTNPWSAAAPDGAGGVAFVIDQSASVVAKSEVMKRARLKQPLPAGWAFDSEGRTTTDPTAALAGTMAPAGGYKGVGAALLVELMAACLTGATPGIAAAPFSGTAGGPPRTGQLFVAFEPKRTSADLFADRLATVVAALAREPAVRLPGARRLAARQKSLRDGVAIDRALHERVSALAQVDGSSSTANALAS
jgi:(2R)-3-sulfolactate dehydrogenase (NADP+)